MIYALKLQKGKYYVGYTERRDGQRFDEHASHNGSKWTQLYPLIVVELYKPGTLEDEDQLTLDYMTRYGWTNVRGGRWCQVEMQKPPEELLDILKRKGEDYRIIANLCERCGRNSHLIETCYAKTHLNGKELKKVDGVPIKSTKVKPENNRDYFSTGFQLALQPERIENLRRLSVVPEAISTRLTENLSGNDLMTVKRHCKFSEYEFLEAIYLYDPCHYDIISSQDVFLAVTNLNIFRYENDTIQSQPLKDIKMIKHEHNYIASDNLVCMIDRDPWVVKLQIYDFASCGWLHNFINIKLNMIHATHFQRSQLQERKFESENGSHGVEKYDDWTFIDDIGISFDEMITRKSTSNLRLFKTLCESDKHFIINNLRIEDNEQPSIVYLSQPYNYGWINCNDVLVVMTTLRVLKYQEGSFTSVNLNEIVTTQYEHNTFRWDQINMKLKNGSTVKIGIYDAVSCQFFIDCIIKSIT